jgi:DNA relaxase NicK
MQCQYGTQLRYFGESLGFSASEIFDIGQNIIPHSNHLRRNIREQITLLFIDFFTFRSATLTCVSSLPLLKQEELLRNIGIMKEEVFLRNVGNDHHFYPEARGGISLCNAGNHLPQQ